MERVGVVAPTPAAAAAAEGEGSGLLSAAAAKGNGCELERPWALEDVAVEIEEELDISRCIVCGREDEGVGESTGGDRGAA